MDSVDCIIVGAGVVGLAIARRLALAGREVMVLEAAGAIGTETSSRNSEVIHAGIYYPKDSLMARSCVVGKEALYRFCHERQIPHLACGKLIVATNETELMQLASIKTRAEQNGVNDIRILNAAEARNLEPSLFCTGALLSPSTGIIDSHSYMLAMQADIESLGGFIALHSPVLEGSVTPHGIVVTAGADSPLKLHCRTMINAAGLYATDLARKIRGLSSQLIPETRYAKGNYFSLLGKSPFSRLIYPVPVAGGLGIHFTLDLAGRARFGPDVEWISDIDYTVNATRADTFYRAIRRYWPDLKDGSLQPSYSGIRPKTAPLGVSSQDFSIVGPETHGVRGLINLFGIESPGLTASLALAELVTKMAEA
jgi:L-2-hydroxyglutarate oxidase LhgO